MTRSDSLNDRIAKAKGWRLSEWYEDPGVPGTRSKTPLHTHWYNPAKELEIAGPPNFTGTLEGVAGMMRELQEKQDQIDERNPYCSIDGRGVWSWRYLTHRKEYLCACVNAITQTEYAAFVSPPDRPGDCVGEALLSVLAKEAGDDN